MIFDVPRVNTITRDSLITPVKSTMVYNIDNNSYEYYDGVSWKVFVGSSSSGIIQVQSTTKSNAFYLGGTNSFSDISGLNVTIKPKYVTSKILVI